MTDINFDDIRVGDRIRLTRTGEPTTTVTLTVGRRSSRYQIWGENELTSFSDDIWTAELIERPVVIPTTPGVYQFKESPENHRYLVLSTHGLWSWLDLTSNHHAYEPLSTFPPIYADQIELAWAKPLKETIL